MTMGQTPGHNNGNGGNTQNKTGKVLEIS